MDHNAKKTWKDIKKAMVTNEWDKLQSVKGEKEWMAKEIIELVIEWRKHKNKNKVKYKIQEIYGIAEKTWVI